MPRKEKEIDPALYQQWDSDKNGALKLSNFAPFSRTKVWWKCDKGHEWQAAMSSRSSGYGCPYCTGKYVWPGSTDLSTTHPYLAAQWDKAKNGNLTPQMFTKGSEKKVWWKCEKGHEWKASINSRALNNSGCPICANKVVLSGYNDLKTVSPKIADEWDYEKNGDLKPTDVVFGSNRTVWWKCKYGHEWRAKISDRTSGTNNCPYCSNHKVLPGYNDLLTTHPDLAKQWNSELNGSLTPDMVTAGSAGRGWWICPEGHVWRTKVYNRTGPNKQTGCPVCAGNLRTKYKIDQYHDRCRIAEDKALSEKIEK